MAYGRQSDGFSLHHWLMLAHADRVPVHEIYDMLRDHATPRDALAGSRRGRLSSLPASVFDARIKKCLEWSSEGQNHVICLGGEQYPQSLLESPAPPVVLFASGNLDLLKRPKLLVIGEEVATPAGAENARIISRALTSSGVCLATGVRGGIEQAVCRGIAEVSAGKIGLLDSVFDAEGSLRGAKEMSGDGMMLYGGSFPGLGDRHQSAAYGIGVGVADACLVIEAALGSKVMQIAQHALEAGKEVLAMPGSVNSTNYRGSHRLIRDGAHLIENHSDVLEALRGKAARS